MWDKKNSERNPNKPVRHDRFLRGGAEDQPDTFTPSGASPHEPAGTGGSESSLKEKQFFRRTPMITET